MAKLRMQIKNHTANHPTTLKELNEKLKKNFDGKDAYVLSRAENSDELFIEPVGGVVEEVKADEDNTSSIQKAVVEQVVKKGAMLTYSSRIVAGSKIYTSLPMCSKLGALSALVAKEVGATTAKAGKASLNDVLAGL